MGTFLSIARNFIVILIKHTLLISHNPKMIDQWTCLKRGNTKISLCSSGSSVLVCQRMGRHHELHTEWAGNSHGICGRKTWTVQIPALILLNSHGSRLSPRGALTQPPTRRQSCDSIPIGAKAHRKKQITPQGDHNDFVMLHDVEQMLLESNVEHIGTVFACICYTLWWTNIAMENHHAINGKIHYFYGHFQLQLLVHQRVIIQHIGCHEFWRGF